VAGIRHKPSNSYIETKVTILSFAQGLCKKAQVHVP